MGAVTGEQGALEGQSHKADPNSSLRPVMEMVVMTMMMVVGGGEPWVVVVTVVMVLVMMMVQC